VSRHDDHHNNGRRQAGANVHGIIVNFTNRTVQGFGYPGLSDFPVKITAWNEVTVAFYGSNTLGQAVEESIRGTIDRVTGDLEATYSSFNLKTKNIGTSTSYLLKCRPTQRIF
jgi:hypothetical protein